MYTRLWMFLVPALLIGLLTATCTTTEASRGKTIYLNDFSRIIPQDAVSNGGGGTAATSDYWTSVYHVEGSKVISQFVEPGSKVSGKWSLLPLNGKTVLYADGSTRLPVLTYPLDLKGWYDIYIGLVERPYTIDAADWQGIHLKLTNDQWYTHLCGGRTGLGMEWETAQVDEIFWKRADLTGQNISIFQPHGNYFKPAGGISYIKLVPRTEKQVKADNQKNEKTIRKSGTKDVCGMADFISYVLVRQTSKAKETEEVIDNHKNAGLETIFFQINGDGLVHYPSKVAQMVYFEGMDDPHNEYKAVMEMYKDHDPLKVASERANKIGVKFFPWFRMTNEQHPDSDTNEYSKNFRHLKIRGADGDEPRWQSLAYPEIRAYKLAILKELVTDYKVDGLLLDYLRTMPMIGYEPPVVEAYVKKYGVDPTKVIKERSNPRWKKFRAAYITDFMREAKKIVDAEEKKSGRNIEIAVRVTPRDNLWKGTDVQTWIKEGLVDIVIPCNYTWFDPYVSIAPFKKMAKGTNCKIYGGINPFFAGSEDWASDTLDVEEPILKRLYQGFTDLDFSQRVLEYYQQGADGVVFYESETLTSHDPPSYPGREGVIPMFQKFSDPGKVLSYVKELESSK